MDYPITLTFKIMAIAPQIYVRDAHGNLLFYVKQKLFKLKEAINVFADEQQSELLCNINADRIIDFSATYHFSTPDGSKLGGVSRKGMRSIFKARYNVFKGEDKEQPYLEVNEDNAFVKVMDAIFGEIPVLGIFAGYVFNPSYTVKREDGTPVLQIKKRPAFLEGKFEVTKLGDMDTDEETHVMLSVLMILLLERSRG